MELTEEQKKVLEEQKQNCIFCQIVSGLVQAKKVYEDDKIIAILDINPASKGHTLVMPKEHYPIMPLIDPEDLGYFFKKIKEISAGIKKGAVCLSDNIFIANGAAAGQQSNHFMAHIIPRDDNDGLNNFDAPQNEVLDVEKTAEALKTRLNSMLKKNTKQVQIQKDITKEEVIKIINSNQKLVEIIKTTPDEFKKIIPTSPELVAMFKDKDEDEIINEIIGKKDEKKKDNQKNDLKDNKKDNDKADLDKIAEMFS